MMARILTEVSACLIADRNFWCNFWEGNASTECHSSGEHCLNSLGPSCLASFWCGILVSVGIPLFICASGGSHHFHCSNWPCCIHRVRNHNDFQFVLTSMAQSMSVGRHYTEDKI